MSSVRVSTNTVGYIQRDHTGNLTGVDVVGDPRSIGVFDSGIGGLTVVRALLEELPNEQIVYFGDTARCPYGVRTPEEVMLFSRQILDFLYQQNVKIMVIACNTATAVALSALQPRYRIPVVGVIQPGARAAAKVTLSREIGVIGTPVTIDSGAYEQAVLEHCVDARVHSLACPTFVPWVERGVWAGPEVESDVLQVLQSFSEYSIDTLILGCTHYPLLHGPIQKAVGPNVRLISSAHETAVEVREILSLRDELADEVLSQRHKFYASGDTDSMLTAIRSWIHLGEHQFECIVQALPELEGLPVFANS